jgi:SMC interacting uncharacterized protein involved in chromosome segregation
VIVCEWKTAIAASFKNLSGNVMHIILFTQINVTQPALTLIKCVAYLLQTMLSYYFKTYELFKKGDSENMAVEDSKLYQEMEKNCNISEKDIRSMKNEVEKLRMQVEAVVKEEEAAKLATAEQEREITSFQNDLKKQQNFAQELYAYESQLDNSINKWSSKPNELGESIESAKADILRMRNIVDNQNITLEDRKQAEKEYRELEESIEMDQAFCDACLKSMYADDLQIAKLVNESKANNAAYSATLIEYSNMIPELNLINMPVSALHKDVDQTMQVSIKMTKHSFLSVYTMHFHNIFVINQPIHYLDKCY